jgi:hypothetical protein
MIKYQKDENRNKKAGPSDRKQGNKRNFKIETVAQNSFGNSAWSNWRICFFLFYRRTLHGFSIPKGCDSKFGFRGIFWPVYNE